MTVITFTEKALKTCTPQQIEAICKMCSPAIGIISVHVDQYVPLNWPKGYVTFRKDYVEHEGSEYGGIHPYGEIEHSAERNL